MESSSCRGKCVINGAICEECKHHCSVEFRSDLKKDASIKIDEWETTESGESLYKKQINKIIVEELKPIIIGKEKFATMLTLDGNNMYTSKTWIHKLGIMAYNITIPAPFQTSHIETQSREGNEYLIEVNIKKEFLYDTLANSTTPYVGIFMDYCGTIDGNKWCRPYLDIDILFRRNLVCPVNFDQSILFVTFCGRNQYVKKSNGKSLLQGKTFSSLISTIQKISKHYGYFADVCQTLSYKPAMFVCGFKITKITVIDEVKVDIKEEKLSKRKRKNRAMKRRKRIKKENMNQDVSTLPEFTEMKYPIDEATKDNLAPVTHACQKCKHHDVYGDLKKRFECGIEMYLAG